MAKVTIPYNIIDPALKWAKDNCPSYITNNVVPVSFVEANDSDYISVRVIFHFSEEKDATLFALRWTQNE
jgi:hypothetical protein